MGGRIITERLRCGKHVGADWSEAYVRLIINDGIVAIRDSHHDGMAMLASFLQQLHDGREEVGDFKEICGLDESALAVSPSCTNEG